MIPLELAALAAQAWPAQQAHDKRGCMAHLPLQPASIPSAGMAGPKGVLGTERGHSLPLPPKPGQPLQPCYHRGQRG